MMNWLKQLFARRRLYDDLSAEMQQHLEEKIEELVAGGMPRKDATASARRAFGNLTLIENDSHDVWRWSSLEGFFADVRCGLRALLRNRGVSFICVLVLALGIGASTALYSAWKASLIFPYDFENNGRWIALLAGFNRQQTRSWFFSVSEYNDLRQLRDIFESTSALQHIMFNLTENGHPESFDVTAVSADAIRNTGVQPILGRSFLPGEDTLGGPNVVLISDILWQRRFQRDPNVLGKQIRMNGESYSVIGVMPPYFLMWGTQLWVPLRIDQNDRDRSHRAYWITAMIKKGVTQKQVNARLAVVARQWEQVNGSQAPEYKDLRLWSEDILAFINSSIKNAMLVLLGAIALLLVITCANVTNILLARVTARRREIAIRLAIGGSRARITRQFLTESVLLSVIAGGLGLLIAWQSVPLIGGLVVDYVATEAREFKLDFSGCLFAIFLSIFVGLIYGLAPAVQATKTSLTTTLKEGGRNAGGSQGGQWWRKSLVVTQVSLSLIVLAAASLMIQSYSQLANSSLGFNPEHVLESNITLPETSYPALPQTISFFEQLQRSVSTMPGVEASGAVSSLPVLDRLDRQDFHVEGRSTNASDSVGGAAIRFATPGYFSALQISLETGRVFSDDDRQDRQPVAVINQTLAKRFWPNESALGKHIELGNQYSERIASAYAGSVPSVPRWLTIVGVLHDTRQIQEWDTAIQPEIYLPFAQSSTPLRDMRLVLRSQQSPSTLVESLRQTVAGLDPALPLGNSQAMHEIVRDAYGTERLALVLLTIFAIVSLILAVAGVYALLSYNVTQQSHEIGIRMALGALPREVLALILRGGARLALVGVAFGVAGGLFLTRLMTSLLYQVSASNPFIFAGTAIVLLASALLACYLPARRATRVDPIVALRHE
jgi:predicted permease